MRPVRRNPGGAGSASWVLACPNSLTDHQLEISPQRTTSSISPIAPKQGGVLKQPLRLVRLPALMDITVGVPEITVALIDGPIALDHPDLTAQNIRSLNQNKRDQCAKPESFACTHGTYVAGLLNAKRDSAVPGICPGLHACRATRFFGGGGGSRKTRAYPAQPSLSWPPHFSK